MDVGNASYLNRWYVRSMDTLERWFTGPLHRWFVRSLVADNLGTLVIVLSKQMTCFTNTYTNTLVRWLPFNAGSLVRWILGNIGSLVRWILGTLDPWYAGSLVTLDPW